MLRCGEALLILYFTVVVHLYVLLRWFEKIRLFDRRVSVHGSSLVRVPVEDIFVLFFPSLGGRESVTLKYAVKVGELREGVLNDFCSRL